LINLQKSIQSHRKPVTMARNTLNYLEKANSLEEVALIATIH